MLMLSRDYFPIQGDKDACEDFHEDFSGRLEAIETIVSRLEKVGTDDHLSNELLLTLDVLKTHAAACQIAPLVESIESFRQFIDRVRILKIPFDILLCEFCLHIVDDLHAVAQEAANVRAINFRHFSKIQSVLSFLLHIDNETKDAALEQALGDLANVDAKQDDGYEDDIDDFLFDMPVRDEKKAESEDAVEHILSLNITSNHAVGFMHCLEQLSRAAESKFDHWKQRTDFILSYALTMNALSGNVVPIEHLAMAVYCHDLGMLFMPDSLCTTKAKLSDAELEKLHTHPQISAHYLRAFPELIDVLHIVEQHHEREDGKGYPNQLMGKDIHDGAKILALCDTLYALIHARPDRPARKGVLHALAIIKQNVGSQFDEYWFEKLYEVIRIKHIQGLI